MSTDIPINLCFVDNIKLSEAWRFDCCRIGMNVKSCAMIKHTFSQILSEMMARFMSIATCCDRSRPHVDIRPTYDDTETRSLDTATTGRSANSERGIVDLVRYAGSVLDCGTVTAWWM